MNGLIQRVCPGCTRLLPRTLVYFYPAPMNHDGLRTKCRECIKEEAREYYAAKREEIRAAARERYQERAEMFRTRWQAA